MTRRSIIELVDAIGQTGLDMEAEEIHRELAAQCADLLAPLATIMRGAQWREYVAAWLKVAAVLGLSLERIMKEIDRQKKMEQK